MPTGPTLPAVPGGALRTLLVLPLLSLIVLVATGAPAMAHGRSSDSSNFDSTVTATPGIDGATWRIYGADEYLSVTNTGPTEITVLGYEGEPYLRIGPDGVFRNSLSAATYVNEGRYTTQPPAGVETDPAAEPEWEQLSTGNSWYWHDHRTHWMAPTLPPMVRAAPGEVHEILDWEVPVVASGERLAVSGDLRWIPGPSVLPWLALGLLASLPALLGLLAGRDADPLRLARPAAVVLGLVALVNVFHLADDLFAAPAPLSDRLLAVVQTTLFIVVGLFGAVRAWKGGDGAFTALGVGSAATFVGQGLLYLSSLTASQVTSLAPDFVGRFAIAWSLLQVLTVGAVAVVGTRRMMPDPEPWPEDERVRDGRAGGASAAPG